jgi:leader peptidase (prepilin peptidase)/N-methyltransferase
VYTLIYLFLFVFGAFLGSYLNVLESRYSSETGFKLSQKGRSYCDSCKKILKWYELIPLFSFIVQRGKCRSCGERIPLQYPIVEFLSGLILVLVPMRIGFTVPALLWSLAFLIFILIFIIDLRLRLIPDLLNLFVGFLGASLISYYAITGTFGVTGGRINGSFLGTYAPAFWIFDQNVYANFALGIVSGLIFFWAIYFLTKGRGIGFGDVKLAFALGALMGWPDTPFALVLSFVLGAIVGLVLLGLRKKRLKEAIPFGPFMIAGVTLVFFFGYDILNGYFGLFNIY